MRTLPGCCQKPGPSCSKQVTNPVQGIRTSTVRLTWLAWGASSLATGGTGDPDRALPANPAGVNSSTMKGPKGLASEDCGRRCQTAKDFHRRVRGCFYVRSPEITINIWCKQCAPREWCARDGGPAD
jgi:hypothetical protein